MTSVLQFKDVRSGFHGRENLGRVFPPFLDERFEWRIAGGEIALRQSVLVAYAIGGLSIALWLIRRRFAN